MVIIYYYCRQYYSLMGDTGPGSLWRSDDRMWYVQHGPTERDVWDVRRGSWVGGRRKYVRDEPLDPLAYPGLFTQTTGNKLVSEGAVPGRADDTAIHTAGAFARRNVRVASLRRNIQHVVS